MTNSSMGRAAFAALFLLLTSGTAVAGPCDAYFSFDGNLLDGAGEGYDGVMIDASNQAAAPQFVGGKFGQALRFDGTTAMRSVIDLHPQACPDVTISAWVKVETPDSTGGYLVSASNGYAPALRILGNDDLQLVGMQNGLIAHNVLFSGSWIFVALVYDHTNKEYRLHWGNQRQMEKTFTGDPQPPNSAMWVGAYGETVRSGVSGVVIDDLRITGRALDETEIAQLRSSPGDAAAVAATGAAEPASTTAGCTASADCPSGSYCAVDGACYPTSQLPADGAAAGTSATGSTGGLLNTSQYDNLDFGGVARPDLGVGLKGTDPAAYPLSSPGAGLAGRWQSVTTGDGGAAGGQTGLAVTVDFYGADTNLSGHLWIIGASMLGQVEQDEPLTGVSRSGDTVRFSGEMLGGEFIGQVSDDESRITGSSVDLVLERIAAGDEFLPDSGATGTDAGQVMAGNWLFREMSEGMFWSPGSGATFTLQFTGPDSVLSGQLVMEIIFFGTVGEETEPLRNILKNGQTVSFSSDRFGNMTGQLSEDNTLLTLTSDDPSTSGTLVFSKL